MSREAACHPAPPLPAEHETRSAEINKWFPISLTGIIAYDAKIQPQSSRNLEVRLNEILEEIATLRTVPMTKLIVGSSGLADRLNTLFDDLFEYRVFNLLTRGANDGRGVDDVFRSKAVHQLIKWPPEPRDNEGVPV